MRCVSIKVTAPITGTVLRLTKTESFTKATAPITGTVLRLTKTENFIKVTAPITGTVFSDFLQE